MSKDTEDQKIKDNLSRIIPSSIWKVFESEETAVKISEICFKNGVTDEKKIEGIAYRVGLVLLGQLSLEDLTSAISAITKLSSAVTADISRGIKESVFAPIKNDLEKLYEEKPEKEAGSTQTGEKPGQPSKSDFYREQVE